MDILYISPKAKRRLANYCENELIEFVFNHFEQHGTIIRKNENENPSCWWVATDYIRNQSINDRNRFAVILSFASIGGIIQIGEAQFIGDVNVICFLKEQNLISEEDFDYFVEVFFDISRGERIKFYLLR